jgi:hypothetical protein
VPSLQPVTEGTETLTAVAEGAETLTALAVGQETLGALIEQDWGYEYLYPGASTFPGATTYPGLYGEEVGFRLTPLNEGSETLTALSES